MIRFGAACLFKILFSVFCFMSMLSSAHAEQEIHIGRFSASDLTGWKEQTVFGSGKTAYTFMSNNTGKNILAAKSLNAASGMIYKIDLDPKVHQLIKWSWKIDHTIKKANERVKEGHDFAAKIYVIFPRGFFSQTRAIEYVWGNVMYKDEVLRSPYSKNVVMIAVDAGNELAGKWVMHKRNFYEDYRNAFNEEPPRVGAIAFMTDSDNTGESVTGYYGDIFILPAVKAEEPKAKDKTKELVKPKEAAASSKDTQKVTPQKEEAPKTAPPADSVPATSTTSPQTTPVQPGTK